MGGCAPPEAAIPCLCANHVPSICPLCAHHMPPTPHDTTPCSPNLPLFHSC